MPDYRHYRSLNHHIVRTMNTRLDLKRHKEPLITAGGVTVILLMTLLFLLRS